VLLNDAVELINAGEVILFVFFAKKGVKHPQLLILVILQRQLGSLEPFSE
jgi:hypothetical protein